MFTSAFSSNKYLFWIVASCIALAGAGITYRYFNESFPIVSLTIQMDREQALIAADQLCSKHAWLPAEHRSAVEFKSDSFLQFFIELECGGKKAFSDLLHSKEYEPYQWHVRHFQEKVTHETSLFFTPEGNAYGFELKLPETEMLPTLTIQEAREQAKQLAAEEWNVDFTTYKEIEASKEQKPCGRLDHTFVYERIDAQLGAEGKYRLKLVISGNLLTKVERFVFIPETFVRRFDQMRSSNTTVSTFGELGFQLLYRFFGCLVAGFFFLQRRYLRLTPAIYWGIFFGILTTATILNNLPLSWMSYDTATSASSFLIKTVLEAILQGCFVSIVLTTLISICLTWDRLGFPLHLTFEKLWSSTVGASTAIWGRTIGGYIFIPAWIGFMTGIYLLFTKVFHWWIPADTLVNPNILATYIPWLTPFALSAQAGFIEELLFRALPLAACALGGRILKQEKTSIFVGFIIQALIFGACHANYPQTPGYFRLVEIFIPSLAFGFLYLFYGLLPGIIAHFLYDFWFMSLPIFATTKNSHALLNKLFVIMLMFFPIFIIIYRRYKYKTWYNITHDDRNRTTLNPHGSKPEFSASEIKTFTKTQLPSFNKKILTISGLLGIILWLWATPFTANTPSIHISKEEALTIAQQDFVSKNITTPEGFIWRHYPYITTTFSNMDAFVWREEGIDKYHELLGSYLTPPSWAVRFISFSGPIVERAQEFTSIISPDGSVLRSNLLLPESAPGATLSEAQARGIALEAIQNERGLLPEALKEISAVVQDRPQRKDWTFTFQDKSISFTSGGEARISVTILGDKITNVYQHVFVPEAWSRNELQTSLYRNFLNFFIIFIMIATFILSFFIIQKHFFTRFSTRIIFLWTLSFFVLGLLAFLNNSLQVFAITLNSSQPYTVQIFSLLTFSTLKLLAYWSLIAVCITGTTGLITSQTDSTKLVAFFACGAELLRSSASQVILFLTHDRFLPLVPDYLSYNSYIPIYSVISASLFSFVQTTLFEMICIAGFIHLTQKTNYQRAWAICFFIISSIISCGTMGATLFIHPISLILFGIVRGSLSTAFYYLLIRYDQRAIIMMIGTRTALVALENGILQAYPNAFLYTGCAAIIVIVGSYYWLTKLEKE